MKTRIIRKYLLSIIATSFISLNSYGETYYSTNSRCDFDAELGQLSGVEFLAQSVKSKSDRIEGLLLVKLKIPNGYVITAGLAHARLNKGSMIVDASETSQIGVKAEILKDLKNPMRADSVKITQNGEVREYNCD